MSKEPTPKRKMTWFTSKKRAKMMAIFAGLEDLGWGYNDMAAALGYRAMSGFYRIYQDNGNPRRAKYNTLLALEKRYLNQDNPHETKPLPKAPDPPSLNQIIPTVTPTIAPPAPPRVLSFEDALGEFNTAMDLVVSAANTLKNTAPSNFKSWAHNLNTAIERIFDTYGSDDQVS